MDAMMEKNKKELILLNKDNNNEFRVTNFGDGKMKIGDREFDCFFERTEDGFSFMHVDGMCYPLEIVSYHQNDYEILMNGVTYRFSVETPFSYERRKLLLSRNNESTLIHLKAPMPGKILNVLVKAGDIVKKGDTLVVLEAMKMQNAILASTNGVIKKVCIKEGENTSKNDLLIELEREVL